MVSVQNRPILLRQGSVDQTIFRANRDALARAREFLGYNSVQEMIVDTVEKAVADQTWREDRIARQQSALERLADLDLSDLGAITAYTPISVKY